MRLRVTSAIGFLLRYSTQIDSGVTSLNMPSVIIEVLSVEKDANIRRK